MSSINLCVVESPKFKSLLVNKSQCKLSVNQGLFCHKMSSQYAGGAVLLDFELWLNQSI